MKQHGIRTRILGKPSEGSGEILDTVKVLLDVLEEVTIGVSTTDDE